MVPQLRAIDRVSIVVYAGSAGLVLAPTPGDQHARIGAALDGLSAGGSTAGGAGIELAYAMAREAFIDGGVNRVILATDGDFNVGTTDTAALKTLVEDRRRSGIALSTLGFGAGNYNDELAEQLADVGNGNHAYIDDAREARKVLVEEMSSTLLTIASDVKVQLEFNPATVAEYRLIGYENRALRREDFNNDRVDAGEIGAGHDVTALYELTLVGAPTRSSDPLRYARPAPTARGTAAELGFLKLRYKRPGEDRSVLLQQAIGRGEVRERASPRLAFAASVVAFADHLRGGTHMGGFDLDAVARLAQGAIGDDPGGQRSEFVALVRSAESLRTPEPPRTAAIAD
jgi:Ca-activated chloride channel family protein